MDRPKRHGKTTAEHVTFDAAEDGFVVYRCPVKGRGVVTLKSFKDGDFVVEYKGELVSRSVGIRREVSEYCGDCSFLFFFHFQGKNYCIDATPETKNLGRLINHSRKGNLRRRIVDDGGKPRLCLFASGDIASGTELLYDYGDTRASAIRWNPWLKYDERPLSFEPKVALQLDSEIWRKICNVPLAVGLVSAGESAVNQNKVLSDVGPSLNSPKYSEDESHDTSASILQPTAHTTVETSSDSEYEKNAHYDVASPNHPEVVTLPKEKQPSEVGFTTLSELDCSLDGSEDCEIPKRKICNVPLPVWFISACAPAVHQNKVLSDVGPSLNSPEWSEDESHDTSASILQPTALTTVETSSDGEYEKNADYDVASPNHPEVFTLPKEKQPSEVGLTTLSELDCSLDGSDYFEISKRKICNVPLAVGLVSAGASAVNQNKVVSDVGPSLNSPECSEHESHDTSASILQPTALTTVETSSDGEYEKNADYDVASPNHPEVFTLPKEKQPSEVGLTTLSELDCSLDGSDYFEISKRKICNVPLAVGLVSAGASAVNQNKVVSGVGPSLNSPECSEHESHDTSASILQPTALTTVETSSDGEYEKNADYDVASPNHPEVLPLTKEKQPSEVGFNIFGKLDCSLDGSEDSEISKLVLRASSLLEKDAAKTETGPYVLRRRKTPPVVSTSSEDEDWGPDSDEYLPSSADEADQVSSEEDSQDSISKQSASDASSAPEAVVEKELESSCPSPPAANSIVEPRESNASAKNEKKESRLASTINCALTVMSKKGKERDHSKRFPCVYCGKLVLKLPDHLQHKHPEEVDVKEMLSLKLKSHERKALISKIRARGNFAHNKKAIESGKGVIIPKRRVVERSPSKLVACPFCGETYTKTWFYKHRNTCFLRPSSSAEHPISIDGPPSSSVDDSQKKFRLPAARTGQFMLGSKISEATKDDFDVNVVKKLKPNCDISDEIQKDPLLLTFGLEMLDMLAGREDQHNYIRCKLRELGRLLLQLKQDNEQINCLLDALKPSHFEEIVAATLKVSGYEPKSGTFGTPSLAKRIGESLQKCASIASKDAIITGDETMRKEVADFIVLMDIDWSKRVSRKATFTLKEGKYNKETQIPDKQDVVKIVSFIENESKSVLEKLQADPTNSKLYNRLVMVTLASVIIFNRKRPGDTHKLWVTTYSKSSTDNTHESIRESLTSEQKELVDSLKRVETRGKKGIKIPILFTKKMQTSINLLLSLRENCSVPRENKYVFASVGTSSFVRGSDALRWCREQAGCKHPERLTATCLRKEAATLAKISGLTEGQVEELAGFLGHSIGTHQQYYRLPESTIQTAMVSQYLCKISSTSTGDSTQDESQSYGEDTTDSDTDQGEERGSTRKGKSTSRKKGLKRIGQKGKQTTGIPTPKTKLAKKKQLWTTPQKACVYKHLGGNIDSYKLPGKKDCEKCLRDSPLKTRKWEDVKSFCRYEIKRRLKQASEAP